MAALDCFASLAMTRRLDLIGNRSRAGSCARIREERDRDRDQPANDVGVAVAAIMQDHLAVGARSRLALQPYLTDAAPHLVPFIAGRLAKRLEGMTEFDDIAIAILPIVQGGEIVADGELVAWRPGVARRRVEAISLKRRGRIWLARTRAFG